MFDCCDTTNVADTVSSSGETTVIVASLDCAATFSDRVSNVIVVFPATPSVAETVSHSGRGDNCHATSLSIVISPLSPFLPLNDTLSFETDI